MLTIDKIFQASVALKPIIRETPVARANGIASHCQLYLKPENLQNTGSFKLRGSGYKIANLSDEEKARGVIACSAGNHAQGVALAASHFQGGGHQGLRRPGVPGKRLLRRRLSEGAGDPG